MEKDLSGHYPTKYWHKLDSGRIQCDLCPQACKLKEGQRGMCFVRQRENDQVVLTTYGFSSGFCIDPIEKKPLNQFLPGTAVLSFGTAGCNLACRFCQNWELSKARETRVLGEKALPKDIALAAKQHGCTTVAFTYNEPVIFMEYAVDIAKECHKLGIKAVAVTNGYICDEPRKEFYSHMDAANVDLKAFTDEFYRKITGSTLQPVLDTLVYLKHQTDIWFEITTLLIPGHNDSKEEIDKSTKWVIDNLGPDVPMHFTVFHPAWKMTNVPSTPFETVKRAREIAMKNGIRYAYTGNVFDVEGSSTYCHNCGRRIIERNNFEVATYRLTDKGNCEFCGTKCAGVFQEKVGTWGARRQPVQII